jgi:hypothetical protein
MNLIPMKAICSLPVAAHASVRFDSTANFFTKLPFCPYWQMVNRETVSGGNSYAQRPASHEEVMISLRNKVFVGGNAAGLERNLPETGRFGRFQEKPVDYPPAFHVQRNQIEPRHGDYRKSAELG